MRKSLFITLALSLCMAEYGAFAAAPARGGRSGGQSVDNNAPLTSTSVKKARAGANVGAMKNVAGQQPSASVSNVQTGNTGTRTRPGTAVTNTKNSAAPANGVNGARAAATKKAINMGTKVATATENTVISKDCQNAYYGCMDAFCMLDNASGGRCQCNDKITELDKILEEIMKLDEQSMRIATEGVETVEMGEYADQIKARTKSIENEFAENEKKQTTTQAAKKKTLDLSAWNNTGLFDDDDDDIFDTTNQEEKVKIADDMANKKGDELHKEAAKICTQQIPAECKANASMLQMTYAQKIRSDCTGYENSLKQKKSESAQKLQTAQKAVRDAVLEDVKNQNKYTTEGECVIAFDQCMQTTAKCGADYTGCVADDTVLTMNTDGTKGVAASAQVQTSAAKIGISANTLAILTDKAPLCESVLKQCQNVRKGVWSSFLKMIVPTLKTAEVNAEQNRRMNCVGTIVDCYKNACAAQWPDQESAEYDMCLSNPEIVNNLCQIQINKCSTGDTGEQVMEYVKAKLQALRVDACTTEVKQCLQSENNCGEGYINCIGLDKDTIVKMCTNKSTNFKLMACQSKFRNNQYEVQNYVAQVAQGLILNMDNAALSACQDAAKKAMTTFCGSDEKCDSEKAKENMVFNNADTLTGDLKYKFCPMNPATGIISYNGCKTNAGALTYNDYTGTNTWVAALTGQINFACFEFSDGTIDVNAESVIDLTPSDEEPSEEDKKAIAVTKQFEQALLTSQTAPKFRAAYSNACRWGTGGNANYAEGSRIADILNKKVKRILGKIESDNTVLQCVKGRDLKGITTYTNIPDSEEISDDLWTMKSTSGVGKGNFPNLMAQYRQIVADEVLKAAANAYIGEYNSFVSQNYAKAEKDLDDRFKYIQNQAKTIELRNKMALSSAKAKCIGMTNKAATKYNQSSYSERRRVNRQNKGGLPQWLTAGMTPVFKQVNMVDDANKYMADVEATYNETTQKCTIKTTRYECNDYQAGRRWCEGFFKNNPKTETEEKEIKTGIVVDVNAAIGTDIN